MAAFGSRGASAASGRRTPHSGGVDAAPPAGCANSSAPTVWGSGKRASGAGAGHRRRAEHAELGLAAEGVAGDGHGEIEGQHYRSGDLGLRAKRVAFNLTLELLATRLSVHDPVEGGVGFAFHAEFRFPSPHWTLDNELPITVHDGSPSKNNRCCVQVYQSTRSERASSLKAHRPRLDWNTNSPLFPVPALLGGLAIASVLAVPGSRGPRRRLADPCRLLDRFFRSPQLPKHTLRQTAHTDAHRRPA